MDFSQIIELSAESSGHLWKAHPKILQILLIYF